MLHVFVGLCLIRFTERLPPNSNITIYKYSDMDAMRRVSGRHPFHPVAAAQCVMPKLGKWQLSSWLAI